MQDEQLTAIEAAAKVVDNPEDDQDVVELSNGIKLRCSSVSLVALRRAVTVLPRPQPPIVEITEKGRSEPNPNDPTYLAALEDWEMQRGEVTLNIMLSLGTRLEYVPDTMFHPEDEGWLEPLEAAEVPLKLKSATARYLAWLHFYALATPQNVNLVSVAVARKSGVLEGDVQAALQSFRGGKTGGANLDESSPKKRRSNRDIVPSRNGPPRTRGGRAG